MSLDTVRNALRKSKLNDLLTKTERTRLVEEIREVTVLKELIEEEHAEGLSPDSVIQGSFDWSESIYGEEYWKSVVLRVSGLDDSLGVIGTLSFEAFQDKLETELKKIGYHRKSMHKDDVHRYVSHVSDTTIYTSEGYMNMFIDKQQLSAVPFKQVTRIQKVNKSLVITLQFAVVVVV